MDRIIVSTDSKDIAHIAVRFGVDVLFDTSEYNNGSERTSYAVRDLPGDTSVVLVQGDAVGIRSATIDAVAERTSADLSVVSAFSEVPHNIPGFSSHSSVRVIYLNGKPYFSRWADGPKPRSVHIGIYGASASNFRRYVSLPPANRERSQSLEQYRWIENRYKVSMFRASWPGECISINDQEDLEHYDQRIAFFGDVVL